MKEKEKEKERKNSDNEKPSQQKKEKGLKDERYIRIRELGSGSFGKAYLVKRESNGKYAVIKTMILDGMREDEKKEAFMEANILKELNHSNIIRFIEVFRQSKPKSTLNIVMEHAEGGDLFARIRHQATQGKLIIINLLY